MTTPFVIYAMPRSRTTWLSEFLSYSDWRCYHEIAVTMRSIEDVRAFLARPCTGTSDTAAAPGWRLIRHLAPDVRSVVIRRPIDDVFDSLMQLGIAYDKPALRRILVYLDRLLVEISRQDNCLSVDYEYLDDEGACREIFEHCLPYTFDRPWWLWYKNRDVQMDVRQLMDYYRANKTEIDGFKRLCWRELRALRRAGLLRKAA